MTRCTPRSSSNRPRELGRLVDCRTRDGALVDRRVFAALDGARPDGIALDAEGAVWVASPGTGELLRVKEGGRLLERGPAPNGMAQACALGGADGRTLFACCSPSHDAAEAAEGRAW